MLVKMMFRMYFNIKLLFWLDMRAWPLTCITVDNESNNLVSSTEVKEVSLERTRRPIGTRSSRTPSKGLSASATKI